MYPEPRARIQSLCIGLVRVYQIFISPILPGSCRFLPSCSEYAIQAFGDHGILPGLGLTVWRILRCHPLARGGYDPVPPARAKQHVHHSRFNDAPFQR